MIYLNPASCISNVTVHNYSTVKFYCLQSAVLKLTIFTSTGILYLDYLFQINNTRMASRSSKLKKKHPGDYVPLGLTCSEDNCTEKMKYYSSYLRLVILLGYEWISCVILKLQAHAKGAQEVSGGSIEYCSGSQTRKSWQIWAEEEMPGYWVQKQVLY